MSKTILLVDDDASLARVTQFQLTEAGYQVLTAHRGDDGLRLFQEAQPDLVISDLKMPGLDGLELLTEIKRLSPHILVIVVTAHGSIDTAVSAMKKGAHDYLLKPYEKEELLVVVDKAFQFQGLVQTNLHLQDELLQRYRFENMVGASAAMEKIFRIVRRVSQTDSTVLLLGESGTGKELIARAVHYSSPRRSKPFVAVNCPAIPESLMESELFGHVKGSFTGAMTDRIGKFEQAGGGTVFLDEIADMRLDLQSKLLRVLQEQEIDKVGGKGPVKINVRVIAATNKDLKQCVEDGKFREDLYYRLSVVPVQLPPLRERREDIPLLLQHFLRELGVPHLKVEADVYRTLQLYSFPGNIREMRNLVEQSVVLRQVEDRLTVSDLPEHVSAETAAPSLHALHLDIPPEGINLEEVEKELISLALKKAAGNQNRASQLLGITRQTLIYRMEKYGLKKKAAEEESE